MRSESPLPLWVHLAWLETKSHRAFTLGFVLNVCLGMIGFLTIDAFKSSIQQQLSSKSQSALGADISIWASRLISDDEKQSITKALPSGAKVRYETSLLSMATGIPVTNPGTTSSTRLVEIRAIDQSFPFYGELTLKNQGLIKTTSPKDVVDNPHVWISPELGIQLGLTIGDQLKLGNALFTITDVVTNDPGAMPSGLSFAPKIFVGQDFLKETGLADARSRLWQAMMVATGSASSPADGLEPIVTSLRQSLGKSDLRVRSHIHAANDRNRALIYLNDYLGLVALVALFLAAVGGSFLFQSFLGRRITAIATLAALGLDRMECRLVYGSQLVLLGSMATVLTLLLSLGILPQLPWLLGGILPEGIKPALSWQSAGIALLLGTFGNLLVCLPILHRLGSIQPSRLFQEGQGDGLPYSFDYKQLWTWLPAAAAYWMLAIQQAHSYRVGSLFIGIFLVALLIFAGFGLLLIKFLTVTRKAAGNLSLDLATLALVRHKTGTIASFVAIGMGTLLVNLIPAIKNIVESELQRPQGKAPPSLFLIDIQEEQKDRLTRLVPTLTGGVGLENLSPLIRARLTAINGDTAKASGQNLDNSSSSTREEEESERFVNRGYNLSYRGTKLASETITDGRFFSGEYVPDPEANTPAKIPEISVEERFASRLGLKLEDVMSFDIEGVQVQGRITSLRKVKWTSFDPNFFVLFQPGVLEAAPKTYIGTIPTLSLEAKTQTEMQLVREFPNISMIDLTATGARILALAEQMSQALSLMALLTLISGLAVLFAIAHHQAQKRVIEITLLKILGTDFGTIRINVILEFAILGFAATTLGSLVGITASWVLASQVFESQWTHDPLTPLALALGLGTTCTVTGFYAVNRILKFKPIVLLGNALFDK